MERFHSPLKAENQVNTVKIFLSGFSIFEMILRANLIKSLYNSRYDERGNY